MAHPGYPATQKANLRDSVSRELRRLVEEDDLRFDQAFARYALTTLGIEIDAAQLSDGRGDLGIDYWQVDSRFADVFQFKSYDFSNAFDFENSFGPDSLVDLPRIKSLLANIDDGAAEGNSKVQAFAKELRSAIQRLGVVDEADNPQFSITTYLCCFAADLTAQARSEYNKHAQRSEFKYGSVNVVLNYELILIDDLLSLEWRESNSDWRNKDGKGDDHINIQVRGAVLDSPKSLVFFARAFDLVEAFDQFGYQIFEPNVRCELKRSKVNDAIKNSVKSSRGRKEFKHLNNGITLIAASYQKINRPEGTVLRVRQPGVINGLQTVKSMHDAYDDLNAAEKTDFLEKCEVLVRLHTRDAVSDYRALVKSTNNQNPMQPRNLRSNDPEQINFERLFADLNWFYERKEGAWQAYKSDSRLWGTLKNKKPSDFKSSVTSQIRNIDNLSMSQSWLSFIGFSDQAIHNKKDIFSDERYYNLIFSQRIARHGFEYNFSFLDEAVRGEAESQAPSPHLLLLSNLLREVADAMTPSRAQNRESAIRNLKLEKLKKEEQDAQLSNDPNYIRGLVLAGAKYLFPEFVGYILFKSVGSAIHSFGPRIFKMPTISALAEHMDVSTLEVAVERGEYRPDDLLPTLWALYLECLSHMVVTPLWRQQFEQAAVRSRFNYSTFNRETLLKEADNFDRVYQQRALVRPWSAGFEEHKGVYSFVRHVLLDAEAAKRTETSNKCVETLI